MPRRREPKAKGLKAPRQRAEKRPKPRPKAKLKAKSTDAQRNIARAKESLFQETQMLEAVPGAALPAWAYYFIGVLEAEFGNFLNKVADGVPQIVNVWTDCAGMCTEMFAAKNVEEEILRRFGKCVKFQLFMACDHEPSCEKVINNHHQPKHFSRDIFRRDFEAGTAYCDDCGANVMMPQKGLDIYVCCFPCGPWSARGGRLGFNDKAGPVVWQAIRSVQYMQPVFYFFENVVAISHSHSSDDSKTGVEGNDLCQIQAVMQSHLPNYSHGTLTGVDPTLSGHCVAKNRVLLVGGRADQISDQGILVGFQKMVANPVPVEVDYWRFLGFPETHADHWDRVGQTPSSEEQLALAGMYAAPCRCGIDPMQVCDVHPCGCRKCKSHDPADSSKPPCQWRRRAQEFILRNFRSPAPDGKFFFEYLNRNHDCSIT